MTTKNQSKNIYIYEKINGTERTYDPISRLHRDRIVFVREEINDRMANELVAQLLILEAEDNKKPIEMYINSPGGSITAGLAIIDTMKQIKPKVHTTALGIAASMGAAILAAGTGDRRATSNARIMIHQASGGFRGKTMDAEVQLEEQKFLQNTLYKMLSEVTGKSFDQVHEDCKVDKYMSPIEALKYGLITKIVGKS